MVRKVYNVIAAIHFFLLLLFYTVAAWSEDFTGAVIDYGSWPDQHRRQFSPADANPTIQSTFPKAGFEGGLYAALTKLTDDYFGREWERKDGAVLKIERVLADANWGQSAITDESQTGMTSCAMQRSIGENFPLWPVAGGAERRLYIWSDNGKCFTAEWLVLRSFSEGGNEAASSEKANI